MPGQDGVKPPRIERRGRKPDPEARIFNRSVHALMRQPLDLGGIIHHLTIVTGLAAAEIRARVDRARWDDTPDEPETPKLDSSERKYLGRLYAGSKDPDVIAWMASVKRQPAK